MFITALKTVLTEAVKQTFDSDYPEVDFRNLLASIEYPERVEDYPSVWVDFDPTGELEIVGVDHHEYSEPSSQGNVRHFTRWRFQGYATYTLVAFTSLERDRMLDEFIRVIAFGRESTQTSDFRRYIEDNEFLALNFDFDQIGLRGMTATPGTPWGSDEVIYEVTLAMECLGEFVSDGTSQSLVPLSAVEVTAYSDAQPDPTDSDGWV